MFGNARFDTNLGMKGFGAKLYQFLRGKVIKSDGK